jgi:peroxiredoxin
MSQVAVGQPAPSFRLPSAQGGEVSLEDYAGRRNVILFFAKGMACGFCRQKMSQLARGAPRFQALDADIVMISPTTPERGRFYAKNFPLPFPALCDPDYRVYEAYGMGVRQHSVLWKTRVLAHALRMPQPEATELGAGKPALSELPRFLNDDDLGFFVADKGGTLRYASTAPYVSFDGTKPVGMPPIPSTEEIVAVLERSEVDRRRAAVNDA